MWTSFSDLWRDARHQYSHTVTTALGVGWLTQAVDLSSKLLGLVAIATGLFCSLDKLRRDRQAHDRWMMYRPDSPPVVGPGPRATP